MSQVVVEVEIDDQFQAVQKFVLEGAHAGLVEHAESVLDVAAGSMRVATSRDDHAAAGEPPNVQSGKFRSSLAWAEQGGFIYVGSKASEVGQRGAWFEFAGREQPEEMKRKSRRSTKRKWKPHPFIGPAMEKEQPNFTGRVAKAAFTGGT